MSYQTKVYHKQGGDEMVVASGGAVTVESGGAIKDPAGASLTRDILTLEIADMSADASYYMLAPHAGKIAKVWGTVDGAIATADITITPKLATVAVTNGAVTLPTVGSGGGTRASGTPTAANTITAGDAVEIAVAGGGAGGSPRGRIVLEIERAV
jgi:hypothetical protein